MIAFFKGKLRISVFVPILVAVISLSSDAQFFYVAMLSALMHETAHFVAMKMCGARFLRISLYPFGAHLHCNKMRCQMCGARFLRISLYPFGADIGADTSRLSYKSEIVVFLSGPLMNFVLALLSLLFYFSFKGMLVLAFCISNIIFFFVNILPVRGLDGARVLFCLLCECFDSDRAGKIYDAVTTIFFGVLCALALLLLFLSEYNLSLVFICCYLFISEYIRIKVSENNLLLV